VAPSGAPSTTPSTDQAPLGAPLAARPFSLILPERGWQPVDWGELWRYRELLQFFAWRDIKVRYKQTELGVAWALVEPLLTTGVFAVLFSVLLGSGNEPRAEGVPYFISTFCAMLPWHFFAQASARSSESLIQAQNVITKVYFPRMLLPLSAVATALVDFVIVFVVLVGMMLAVGVVPSWRILLLPPFLFLALGTALAVGLWFSALSAIYRDFRYAQPVVIRLGMYVSPVLFVTSVVESNLPSWFPAWLIPLYALNPMVAVIEGFRFCLLGSLNAPVWMLVCSAAVGLVLLISGVFFFRRMERMIADVI